MKIPLSWLREYVDFDDDAAGVADKLTFSGIEMEGISRIRDGLEGVIVAEITEVSDHPQADRLKLCMVNDGAADLQIVCGADNMKKGDKVALATIGSKLPSGIVIKKAKVRGIESFGMLCAEDELGLSEDHEGIFIVDSSVTNGTRINDVLGEPDDVLDLEITWNRADCLSVLGIAREVAALYGTELKLPVIEYSEGSESASDRISVEVTDAEGCPRYTGRYISGVTVGKSPAWMQSRLSACGIRPISNIVDITNYVLLETGHPLHAFDYDFVEGGSICVRRALKGEEMTTLDGEKRKLPEGTLLIADPKKALAVAGVMGGAGSEIQDSTSDVLLESATFDPASIHKTVVALSLMSESAHRFERGVDFEWVDFASRRAAQLMCDLAGGTVAKGVVDAHESRPVAREISLSMAKLNAVMGIDVEASECDSILTSLECKTQSCEGGFKVTVPEFRRDLVIEADLIEEVARMKGLDSIPAIMPSCHAAGTMDDSRAWGREELRNQLVSFGLTETVNYSFLSERLASIVDSDPGVVLPNPVSADYSVMRGSLAPQMLDTLGRNLSHQNHDCACFEIGKVFRTADGSIAEGEHVCIGLMGKGGRYALDRMSKTTDEETFLWGKGIVESILAERGLKAELELSELSMLEPGAGVRILVDGKDSGWMGIVSSDVRSGYRMLEPVLIAELDVDILLHNEPKSRGIDVIPAFPAVKRDVAVIVEESVLHEDILNVIEGVKCPELTRIELFDIFRGRGLGDGRKSMAYSLTFQASDRTLTDEQANGFRDQIRDGIISKLNAEIREA